MPENQKPRLYIGGIHYATFEQFYDARREGFFNWRERVARQLDEARRETATQRFLQALQEKR